MDCVGRIERSASVLGARRGSAGCCDEAGECAACGIAPDTGAPAAGRTAGSRKPGAPRPPAPTIPPRGRPRPPAPRPPAVGEGLAPASLPSASITDGDSSRARAPGGRGSGFLGTTIGRAMGLGGGAGWCTGADANVMPIDGSIVGSSIEGDEPPLLLPCGLPRTPRRSDWNTIEPLDCAGLPRARDLPKMSSSDCGGLSSLPQMPDQVAKSICSLARRLSKSLTSVSLIRSCTNRSNICEPQNISINYNRKHGYHVC
jgi:hypothetical protein